MKQGAQQTPTHVPQFIIITFTQKDALGLSTNHDRTIDFILYYSTVTLILKVVETHNIFANINIMTKSYFYLKHVYNIKIFVC